VPRSDDAVGADPDEAAGADPVAVMLAADRATGAAGVEVLSYGHGRAVARLRVDEQMLNGHRSAHGGVIFTLADTAFACACNSLAAPSVAAGAEITFVSPARLGDELVAEAEVRTVFGRHGIYDVTVRCGERVVAELRGHASAGAPKPPAS